MQNRKDELEKFKADINLGEYACAAFGFVLDKRLSSRCSAVLRHANGDKLVVTRRPNRHYVYFNVKGDDSGTILDFIQARKQVSLGKIRQELRAWTVVDSNMQATATPIVLRPSQHDAGRVLKAWAQTKAVNEDNDYLGRLRQIPSSVFIDPIFDGQIRTDRRHNVLFGHRNSDGDLSGFEVKNQGFTGFSPGGIKTLFQSAPAPDAEIAVVCESGVDLLSVAAIFGTNGKRFFSTAGQISPLQVECVITALKGNPSLNTIWLAFDNDESGLQLAERFEARLAEPFANCQIIHQLPLQTGHDWNDQLKAKRIAKQDPTP